MSGKTLIVGQFSNGLFGAYSWRVGQVVIEPETFATRGEVIVYFESKGYQVKLG